MSENKYADDLLKQNSLIYDNWKVYRWIYSQLEKQPEKVKDELITFLGTSPMFKAFEADLPVQMGQTIEVNLIIFRKLTREDWLHIVDVCDKSLEKYYLRLKK